jgi:hypothetical protein
MAVGTRASIETGLMQVWTAKEFIKQFYAEDPLYETLKRRKPEIQIGLEALTPIWTGRGGGISMVPSTGSSELNEASPQAVNRAKWEYKRQWGLIELDTAGIEESKESRLAVMSQADLEIEGKLSDMKKQYTRQFFGNGDALIAQFETSAKGKKLKLLKTGLGYQAIRNGWLVPGQVVDIGTKASSKSIIAKKPIVSVTESETEPILEFGEEKETTEEHYVSIANARLNETSYETNGFRNLTSATSTLGGLKPETVPGWAGITEAAKSTPITRQKVIKLRRKIRQKGEVPDWGVTSLKQIEALENESYTQVRFPSVNDQNTGDGTMIKVGNLTVQSHPDCPDEDFYELVTKHTFLLGRDGGGAPKWVTQEYGDSSQVFVWKQGTTYLLSALEQYCELATDRRNSLGRLSELS